MLVREQIISEIKLLSSPELFRIYEFISTIKQSKSRSIENRHANTHYLSVREALSGLKSPLSNLVIDEREDLCGHETINPNI